LDVRALVEQLKRLGLTSYEAKCYVSLVRLGPASPRAVATDASIPYPSAYGALRTLAREDWAEIVTKKPATYRARKPASVRSMVASRIGGAFDDLERMYNPQPTEEAELVYTIRGREKVLAKIYELVDGARESLVLVAPTMGLEDARLLKSLEGAIAKGVEVRAVGDEGAPGILPPGTEIRTGTLVAVDLLVDDKTALISLPDYSACGWIDSPAVASHFKQFLELLWNTSSPA
jgi:HTH-type transcriptional regulator, sugar sensing transcriptional regulator